MKMQKQHAALPFQLKAGRVKICLITSRETSRWIIPKGWPIEGTPPHKVAALEAFEEAGLTGKVASKSVGHFQYVKRLKDGAELDCEVTVYPMLVENQAKHFEEKGQRQILWVARKKASRLVDDKQLSKLVRDFNPKACGLKWQAGRAS